MNESDIAAQQAAKLPQSEPELNPQYPEPEAGAEPTHGIPLADYVMTNEVLDYFGLPQGVKSSPETSQQLQTIMQWAKANSEADGLAGILRTLRHTETILGNTLKPDRFARLHRYVRIQQQKALIAEKERALYV